MKRVITKEKVEEYLQIINKKTANYDIIEKHIWCIRLFARYAGEQWVTQKLVLDYRKRLEVKYTEGVVNMQMAFINCFFKHAGWEECYVKIHFPHNYDQRSTYTQVKGYQSILV